MLKAEESRNEAEKIQTEVTAQNVENHISKSLDSVSAQAETIKKAIADDKVKKMVDGLLTEVMMKKNELTQMSKELTSSFKKKELHLKNAESLMREELKQARTTLTQRESALDRQGESLTRLTQKVDEMKTQLHQTIAEGTQFRIKAEQSQRQIELLNQEMQKLSKKASPEKTENKDSGKMIELKKQMDILNKGLLAKKQELEQAKRSLNEKSAQEAELKKQIQKLQKALTSAGIKVA